MHIYYLMWVPAADVQRSTLWVAIMVAGLGIIPGVGKMLVLRIL